MGTVDRFGFDGRPTGTSGGVSIPEGWVNTAKSLDGLTATYRTTPIHLLRGEATVSATPREDGVYATVAGMGDSPIPGMDTVNELAAPDIFRPTFERQAEWNRQNIPGC